MRTTHWRAYYLTNPNSWYSLPERARILSAIPAIQLLPPVSMAPQSMQKMRDWAETFVVTVCQLSVRQKTTMARAGTSRRTSIREKFSQSNRSASNALTSRSRKKTAGNKTKRKMEYWSTNSPSDDDIPSLEREADFFLGRGSRFGRSIRFNSRIVFG